MRIDVDWTPDLESVQLTLFRLEEYVRNTSAPMFASKLVAIDDTEQHFIEEEDPEGDAWVYWADSYAPRAEIENVGILRKDEDLFYAAINPDAWDITPEGLFFDASNLPDYGMVHQQGETSKPKVPLVKSKFHSGKPGAVPQRAFIGLSDQAEETIEEIFGKWLEEGGEVFVRGGKRVQAHVFQSPTGHFISALR